MRQLSLFIVEERNENVSEIGLKMFITDEEYFEREIWRILYFSIFHSSLRLNMKIEKKFESAQVYKDIFIIFFLISFSFFQSFSSIFWGWKILLVFSYLHFSWPSSWRCYWNCFEFIYIFLNSWNVHQNIFNPKISISSIDITDNCIYSQHDIPELNLQIRDEIDSISLTIVPAKDDLSRQVDYNDDVARMCDDGDLRPEASGYMDPMKHLNNLVHDDSAYF